ncbi:MAG: hypothetical protein GY827_08410 [Cytophagales bacterium]|nr:hypothetical protein [Cytophagales bacterium]
MGKLLDFHRDKSLSGADVFNGESLTTKDYQYIMKSICFWSVDTKEADLYGVKQSDLMAVYMTLSKVLQVPQEVEITEYIKFKKQQYFLPKIGMEKSTVAEFVEATEAEKKVNILKTGSFEALPSLCALFLKQKDEKVTKKFIEETVKEREKLFLDLPMSDAFKVAFFLLKQKESYATFLNSYKGAMEILYQSKLKEKQNLIKALDGIK